MSKIKVKISETKFLSFYKTLHPFVVFDIISKTKRPDLCSSMKKGWEHGRSMTYYYKIDKIEKHELIRLGKSHINFFVII